MSMKSNSFSAMPSIETIGFGRASPPRAQWMPMRPPTSPSPTRTSGRPRRGTAPRPWRHAASRSASSRREGRRALPAVAQRHRLLAVVQVEAAQRAFAPRRRCRPAIEILARAAGPARSPARCAAAGASHGGATKIVLPLTCTVYCEAPTTVARMPSSELLDRAGPRPAMRGGSRRRARGPRSPKSALLAAVDVLGNAAREGDDVGLRARCASGSRRSSAAVSRESGVR